MFGRKEIRERLRDLEDRVRTHDANLRRRQHDEQRADLLARGCLDPEAAIAMMDRYRPAIHGSECGATAAISTGIDGFTQHLPGPRPWISQAELWCRNQHPALWAKDAPK